MVITHRQPEIHNGEGTKIDNNTCTVMKERNVIITHRQPEMHSGEETKSDNYTEITRDTE